MDEVFDRQGRAVQSFLLNTSILERMSAPLCDAILSAVHPGDRFKPAYRE